MQPFSLENNRLLITGSLKINNAEELVEEVSANLLKIPGKNLIIDLFGLRSIDSAGVAAIDQIITNAKEESLSCKIVNASVEIKASLNTFSSLKIPYHKPKTEEFNLLLFLGQKGYGLLGEIKDFIQLTADVFYWGTVGLFDKKGQRKGEFVNQANLIGVDALPIVALLSFLVGFILSLQSAQQLRQFGANIFVVDLISISMTREMGPLLTAIILAGRSGSAIASELASMKISEEIDALKTMALNPIKYVVLPKLYAMTIATPLLTIFSDIIGIVGGFIIGITFLKISPMAFVDRMASVMVLKDIIISIIKSFMFAWIISIVGFYYGFRATGGAEGVGKATTSSVVTAIFMVIIADSIIGLIFY